MIRFIKQLFCKHKKWHTELFAPSLEIRVCDNCGFEDFGFRNKRFKWKIK